MIVLCPLEFERCALQRVAREHGWKLFCTGPGDGPARWIHNASPRAEDDGTIVLAGVAAGLVAPATAGSAWFAGAVVSGAETWRPTWSIAHAPTATLACVNALLADPAAKRRTAAETGASLADMESAPFARAACEAGLRWAVVRGVSDAVHESLPTGVDGWTDSSGRTRYGAVAGSLLRQPGLLPQLLRTGRASAAAMRAVATLLATADNAALPAHGHTPA